MCEGMCMRVGECGHGHEHGMHVGCGCAWHAHGMHVRDRGKAAGPGLEKPVTPLYGPSWCVAACQTPGAKPPVVTKISGPCAGKPRPPDALSGDGKRHPGASISRGQTAKHEMGEMTERANLSGAAEEGKPLRKQPLLLQINNRTNGTLQWVGEWRVYATQPTIMVIPKSRAEAQPERRPPQDLPGACTGFAPGLRGAPECLAQLAFRQSRHCRCTT